MSEIKYLDKIGLQHLVEEIDKKHFARIVTYKPGFGTIITPNNNIVAEVKYEQRDTEWKSFSWTNAGWLSGSHIWVDYNGVIHYDWDFQSDHKYLAEDGVTWVTKTWKGFSGINGSRVWMDYNNNIHYDYSNVHYILGSDNETWEAYTYTGLTVIDRGLWTDYDGIVHYDKGTSHYKLLRDCKTWEEVKWSDVVITAGEKVWKDASGVLHYDDTNTHAVLSDTGVWRKYTWIGDIAIPNGDHVWKSTNGIYHYDDGSTHYVLDENMTWSTFSWPGNVDITANYIWNDPNGITHYDYKDNSNNYHFYLEKEEHKYITNHGDELQTKLTAGSNITIENGVISSTGGGSTDNFYTKAEVDEKISTIPKFSTKVVSALPTSDISTTTIYLLVSTSSKTGNLYTEYIYVDSKWEKLGEQDSNFQIDTSIPATPSDTHALSTKAIDDIRKYGTYAHQFCGTNGAATYIHFCRLKTKTQWNDELCKFEISGRNIHGNIYFKLTSSGGTADASGYRPIIGPTVTYQSDINTESYLYWNQPDQYTLDLYWKKLQANEQYSITSIDIGAYARAGLEITWLDSQVATLPTGNTQASFKSVNDYLPLSGGTMTGTISRYGSGTLFETHERPQSWNTQYCDGYKIDASFDGTGDENKLSIYSSVGSKAGDPVNWVERITITGANDIILKNRVTINETRSGSACVINYQQNGTRWGYMGFSAANTPSVYLTDGTKKNISLEGHTHSDTFSKKGIVNNTTDWNTLTEPGTYKVQCASWGDAATYHSPNSYSATQYSYGLLNVFASNVSDEKRIMQIYYPHGGPTAADKQILFRMHNSNDMAAGWGGWAPIFANTWRGIQNNLTSDSTTDSLSAAQGKILNNKFASYLPAQRMVNGEQHTAAVGITPFNVQALKAAGKPLFSDPEFNSGVNGIVAQNNANNGVVTITRDLYSNISGLQSPANSGGYVLKITTAATGTTTPGIGGFNQQYKPVKNQTIVHIFRALIPNGAVLSAASNPIGTSYTMDWITRRTGTGKWEWYAYVIKAGTDCPGTNTTGFIYVESTGATRPFTWYLSYANMIDISNANYDGLRTVYSDYATSAGTAFNAVFHQNSLSTMPDEKTYIQMSNQNSNSTGLPGTGWYHIINSVWGGKDTSWPSQFAFPTSDSQYKHCYYRYSNNTATYGSGWIRLANASELNSYLPLTGGTLTGDLTLNSSGTITSGNTKAVTGGTVYEYCKNAIKQVNLNGTSVVSGLPGNRRVDLNVVPNTSYQCSRTGSVGELECICETEALTANPMTQHFFIKNNLDAKFCGNLTVVWDGSNFTLSTDNVHLQAYICVEHYNDYGYIYGRVYTQGVKWSVQTLDSVNLFSSNGSFTESLSNVTPVWANCYSSTTKFHICFYVKAYVGGLTTDTCTVRIASQYSKVPLDWSVVSSRYYLSGTSRLLEITLSSTSYQGNYSTLKMGQDMSITYSTTTGLQATFNGFSYFINGSTFKITINTDSIVSSGGFSGYITIHMQ